MSAIAQKPHYTFVDVSLSKSVKHPIYHGVNSVPSEMHRERQRSATGRTQEVHNWTSICIFTLGAHNKKQGRAQSKRPLFITVPRKAVLLLCWFINVRKFPAGARPTKGWEKWVGPTTHPRAFAGLLTTSCRCALSTHTLWHGVCFIESDPWCALPALTKELAANLSSHAQMTAVTQRNWKMIGLKLRINVWDGQRALAAQSIPHGHSQSIGALLFVKCDAVCICYST